MDKMERLKQLTDELDKASYSYYNLSVSLMSDKEFDAKEAELVALEKELGISLPNSITQRVGAKVNANSKNLEVKHNIAALSLDKSKDSNLIVSSLRKSYAKVHPNRKGSVLEWKMDGLTLVLDYKDGKLVRGATRGDGSVGFDITHNIPYINGIAMTIPYDGEATIRGEAVMSYAEFDRINDTLEEPYKHPRNLASATVNLENTPENARLRDRKIDFFAFKLVKDGIESVDNMLETLEEWKFNVTPHELCDVDGKRKLDDAVKAWSEDEYIKAFGYPVDGLVMSINDLEYAESCPGSNRHPSIYVGYALKWQDETVETVLRDIIYNTTRTGVINPIAVFDTRQIEGSDVSKATLHNVSYIFNKDLKIGDRVTVYKANKIIPAIDVNLDMADDEVLGKLSLDEKRVRYNLPTVCPVCGGKVEFGTTSVDGSLVLKCTNDECVAKKVDSFVHFCERNSMNIKDMSSATVEAFVYNGIVHKLSDFWHLEDMKDKIVNLDGFGEKSYSNLITSCKKACENVDFAKFLGALGIDSIAYGKAKIIKNYILDNEYDNSVKAHELMNFEKPAIWDVFVELILNRHFDFSVIPGIGSKLNEKLYDSWVVKEILSTYVTDENSELRIHRRAITFEEETQTVTSTSSLDGNLKGLTFVITGKLNHYSNRNELVSVIESNGGKVADSVSNNTNYLINNDIESTSSKNKKAKSLNIPIITEEDFMKMIV